MSKSSNLSYPWCIIVPQSNSFVVYIFSFSWVQACVNLFASISFQQSFKFSILQGRNLISQIGIVTLGSKLYNPMRIILGQYHLKLGCVKFTVNYRCILNYRMGSTYQIYIWIFYVMAHNVYQFIIYRYIQDKLRIKTI